MKNKVIILGVSALAVVALWSAAWFAGASFVRGEVEKLAANDGETRPRVACGELAISGFPFRFDLTCTEATLVDRDVTARLAELRLSMRVYSPTHILAFAKGPLRLEDAFTGSVRQLDWSALEASARSNWLRLARISVVATDVTLSDALLEPLTLATADKAELHVVDVPAEYDSERHLATLSVYQRFTGLDAAGLGLMGATGSVQAEISALPDDVTSFAAPDAVASWQAAGGEVRLIQAEAGDPGASITADGLATLDDARRLNGSVVVTSKGLVERFATNLQEPLRSILLGTKAEDGSYTQAISFNAGVAFAGIVPIGVIPPLD